MIPSGPPHEHQAFVIEARHQHPRPSIHAAQHVFLRHRAVAEDKFAGVGAAHAQLVQLLRGGETLESFLHNERGNAARRRGGIGLGVDDQRIRLRPIGDPHLAAVEDEEAVPLLGPQAHSDHVRAGLGFRHGQGADVFAADQFGQVLALLRLRALLGDLVHAQVRVRAVREPDGGRGARNLFHRDDVGEIAEIGSAVLLIDRDAQQPQFTEFQPDVAGIAVLAIHLRGDGRDFVQGKPVHGLPQERDRLAQFKVQPFHTLLLEFYGCRGGLTGRCRRRWLQ